MILDYIHQIQLEKLKASFSYRFCFRFKLDMELLQTTYLERKDELCTAVVVVNNVTIVAIGHGLLKKFWPY